MKKSKITSSHSTFIPEANALQQHIAKMAEVTKVSAGYIKSSGAVKRRIKILRETACVLVKVRGVGAVQEVRFYPYACGASAIIELAIKQFAIDNDWAIT